MFSYPPFWMEVKKKRKRMEVEVKEESKIESLFFNLSSLSPGSNIKELASRLESS